MNCKRITPLLARYSEQALSPAWAKAVREHLSGCEHCRRQLEQLNKSWELLGRLPQVDASPDFAQRFWQHADAPRPRHALFPLPRLAWPKLAVPVLTGCIALCGLALYSQYIPGYIAERRTTALYRTAETIEMIHHLELLDHMDMLQEFALLADWEAIESIAL